MPGLDALSAIAPLAAEGGMDIGDISTGVTGIGTAITSVFGFISANPYLLIFLATPVVYVGIKIIKKLSKIGK